MIMAAPKLDAGLGLGSKVILFSNDDPDLLTACRYTMEDAGFRHVYCARTAESTLTQIERLMPDVVITDMCKTEGRWAGEQLARVIRGAPNISHVPLVLSSGWPEIKPAWLQLFDDFFMLPFRNRQLVEFTFSFLRNRS